jgi:hypothetical protein
MYRPPTSPVPDKERTHVDKRNLPETGADTNAEEADRLAALAGTDTEELVVDENGSVVEPAPDVENPAGFTNVDNLTEDEARALSGIGETTGERINDARVDLREDEAETDAFNEARGDALVEKAVEESKAADAGTTE